MRMRTGFFAVVAMVVAAPAAMAQAPSGSGQAVVLLHGLWGGAGSWEGYARHLRDEGWREGCLIRFAAGSATPELVPLERVAGGPTSAATWAPPGVCEGAPAGGRTVFRVVFTDNDGQTFEMQGRQVAAAVARVKGLTGAAKVTLVGHSMGGLAARAYLQAKAYGADVDALITVATPHMGSMLPYLPKSGTGTCRALSRWLGGKNFSAPAVAMLAPDSPEMLALDLPVAPFGPLPADVAYTSIVGDYTTDSDGSCVGYRDWLATWLRRLAAKVDVEKVKSLASAAVLANWSDGVVPAWSQMLKAVPVGWGLDVASEVVTGFHSDLTSLPETWAAIDRHLPKPAAIGSPSDVDLVFCIDTTSSMRDDIDAAKAAASTILDAVFAVSPDPRVGLVAYRDYGDEYVTKGWAFSRDRDEMRRSILALTVDGGGDTPEAVYEAILAALDYETVGPWRNGVKKIVIVIGDAPPHTKKHTLDEVVKRAFEVDPAHVFAIAVDGSSGATVAAFNVLAERTGGVLTRAASAADLPRRMVEMVTISAGMADRSLGLGEVVRITGSYAWIKVGAGTALRPGMTVLFFDPENRRTIVGRGHVTSIVGETVTVEIQERSGGGPLDLRGPVGLPTP